MDEEADARRAAQLAASSRAVSFGQDTSRLYDRDNGKKPWRAEHPATDDEKEIGKAARDDILQRFPLATLNSKELVETHIAYLRDIVQTKGGHEAARARERLSATAAAQQQWLRIPVYQPDRRLAVQARERFVTYIREQPHGKVLHESAVPRKHPYDVGKLACTLLVRVEPACHLAMNIAEHLCRLVSHCCHRLPSTDSCVQPTLLSTL